MQPAIDRFLAKIERDEKTGCWLWTASIRPNGYGQFRFSTEKNGYPHLFAYEHYVGPIPEGHEVDHLCEQKSCVNPAHLEAVQPWVNVHRSKSGPAENALLTHCQHGHEFTPDNTRIDKRGSRVCRTCMYETQVRWRSKNQERSREYSRQWRGRNVEKANASAREGMRRLRAKRKGGTGEPAPPR